MPDVRRMSAWQLWQLERSSHLQYCRTIWLGPAGEHLGWEALRIMAAARDELLRRKVTHL